VHLQDHEPPDEAWILQAARDRLDEQEETLASKRYPILDRDPKYSERFRTVMCERGV
jgi:hypothetical protein